MNALGFSYFRAGSDRWVRLLGFQVGLHMRGRRPLFSERNGYRKPPPTLHLGRKVEVTWCRLRKTR